jgi:hypothetical protein
MTFKSQSASVPNSADPSRSARPVPRSGFLYSGWVRIPQTACRADRLRHRHAKDAIEFSMALAIGSLSPFADSVDVERFMAVSTTLQRSRSLGIYLLTDR